MPNTIKFSDNPNEETAFVTTEDDTRTRVVLTTPVDGTVKFPDNPNSTKVSVTVDGVARKAVAVYNLGGGGGSDQHNLGWYATQAALEEAHPTAEAGDWAIVGATDTVWIWDTDNSEWVDSDQKGQVTSVNNQTGAVTVSEVPSQTGNAGKFLTTDGTDASWSDKPLVNTATPTNSLSILGTNTSSDNTIAIGKGCNVYGSQGNSVVIGNSVSVNYCPEGVAIGNQCTPYNYSVCVGKGSGGASTYGVSLGWRAKVNGTHAIQIGNTGSETMNSDANTMKVANANGNFEMMSADGTIPEARLADTTSAQQGDVLTLDSNGNAVWQASSGGGLPSQTGNSGKFLTTDGTAASWSDTVPAINLSQTLSVNADKKLVVFKNGSTEVGNISATQNGPKIVSGNPNNWGVRIAGNLVPDGDYNLGWSAFGVVHKWNKLYVNKISSGDNNISVPNITGTMAVIQVNTTATLTSAGWSSNTQTVSVTGVSSTSVVFVAPDPADTTDYVSAGILCTSQGTNSLTFTATTTPSADIDVVVVAM